LLQQLLLLSQSRPFVSAQKDAKVGRAHCYRRLETFRNYVSEPVDAAALVLSAYKACMASAFSDLPAVAGLIYRVGVEPSSPVNAHIGHHV